MPEGKRPRVLLVDDDIRFLNGCRRLLHKYDVTAMSTPREAIRVIVEGERFDVIVADYHMPQMDGVTMLRQIMEHDPTASRLLLTGASDMDVAVRAINAGEVMRFLRKPVPQHLLRQVVQDAIERHQATERDSTDLRAYRVVESDGRDMLRDRHQRMTDLIGKGFDVHYQPILHLQTGVVVGYEALSRFTDYSPEHAFIEAHELGLGIDLETRAVELALPALEQFDASIRLWLNVSPGSVTRELYDRCSQWPRLTLELTERDRVSDYDALRRELQPFRASGAQIAIDDAGAGYASMRHVTLLEPDVIKLDRSLVSHVDEDPVRLHLVRALVDFAGEIGCRILGEGIEGEGEARVLRECGVHLGQGYLFGKPRSLPPIGSLRSPTG